jgi:hypothetical protein
LNSLLNTDAFLIPGNVIDISLTNLNQSAKINDVIKINMEDQSQREILIDDNYQFKFPSFEFAVDKNKVGSFPKGTYILSYNFELKFLGNLIRSFPLTVK